MAGRSTVCQPSARPSALSSPLKSPRDPNGETLTDGFVATCRGFLPGRFRVSVSVTLLATECPRAATCPCVLFLISFPPCPPFFEWFFLVLSARVVAGLRWFDSLETLYTLALLVFAASPVSAPP